MKLPAEAVEKLFKLQDTDQIFEKLIEALYRNAVNLGDHVVDGGAHAAMHTLPLADCVGPTGRVYAFEPSPTILPWLRQLVTGSRNVSLMEKALSDRDGVAIFRNLPDEPWLSSLDDRPLGKNVNVVEVEVDTYRLDNLAHKLISFMKLDLEGAEYNALQGAQNVLRISKPVIAMECGRIDAARTSGYSADEFFSFFKKHNYELRDIFGQPFGPSEFMLPWHDRTIAGYIVAAPAGRMAGLNLHMRAIRALT